MHIGVTLPNHRGSDDGDAVVAIGSLTEEMQFDSVWARVRTGVHLRGCG